MKPIAPTTAALAALALAACAGSTGSGKGGLGPPRLARPPAGLSASCAAPLALPDRKLGAAEVENLWGRDRANLVICRDRHSGLLRFFRVRDAGIKGER